MIGVLLGLVCVLVPASGAAAQSVDSGTPLRRRKTRSRPSRLLVQPSRRPPLVPSPLPRSAPAQVVPVVAAVMVGASWASAIRVAG